MQARVESVEALEAVVGACSLGARMKEIDFLDAHARGLLAASRFAVTALAGRNGAVDVLAHGGRPGFAIASSGSALRLPLPPDAVPAVEGREIGVGALFLVPGLGETLRVNGAGRIERGGDGLPALIVEAREVFVHCAKALIRSRFWSPAPAPSLTADAGSDPSANPLDDAAVAAFLSRSPFALVASAGRDGRADVSPKGDPPGFLLRIDGRTLALPDRPGNQRVDTFRNVLERDRVALLALVPGEDHALRLRGRASLSTSAPLRERLAVEGRAPKLALVVEVHDATLGPAPAVAAADLWEPTPEEAVAALPRIGAILRDHVKLNRTRGLRATLLRTAVSERIVESGLQRDYKDRLY